MDAPSALDPFIGLANDHFGTGNRTCSSRPVVRTLILLATGSRARACSHSPVLTVLLTALFGIIFKSFGTDCDR